MLRLIRTTYKNPDFLPLIRLLDAYLAEKDGDDHDFYHQFNGVEGLDFIVLAYTDNIATGCGAIKEFDDHSMEVKRMFVLPKFRGKSVGGAILNELEAWASELGYLNCILETGKRQPEAIQLYKKKGYHIIPNYGQYQDMENSVCFKKQVSSQKK